MNRPGQHEVAVVGAGVVGSALALALARQGHGVALVEPREPAGWCATGDPDLRVFAIAPASVALFQHLGVWDAIVGMRAQPYCHMRVWDAGGEGELHFDGAAQGQPVLGWIIEQAVLQQALWQAVLAEPSITRHCPDRVATLEQQQDGVVLGLDSGARLRAGVAVAADGGDSALRGMAGIEVERKDYRQRGVVAFVETGGPHQDTAWQRFLGTGPLAFLPFADGRCSIVWTLPEAEAERVLALPERAFCAELERAFDARLGPVTAVSKRAAFPLRRQLARAFARDRVALAGDAAHVVHPLAGQGVNLGLQDVAWLERGFRASTGIGTAVPGYSQRSGPGQRSSAAASGHVPRLLQRYARARRSDSTLAAYAFEAINLGFSNDALLPVLLRRHALGLADRLPLLKRFLADHAAGWS